MALTYAAGAIVVLIILALTISSISYSRQQALMLRQKRLALYKKAASELLGYQHALLRVDPEYDLLTLFQKQIISNLINALEADPDDFEARTSLPGAKSALNDYQQGQRSVELNQEIEDTEQHKRTMTQLSAMTKTLDLIMNRGEISAEKRNELGEHLKFIRLQVDVKSHRKQAQIFAEQGERILHHKHLKRARDTLTKSSIQFEGKNELIKELTEELNELKRSNNLASNRNTQEDDAKLSAENLEPESKPKQA